MKVIQHSVETLQTALLSNQERHLLEEGFHPGQPGSLFQPSDSDWISAHPGDHNTIYIQTIGSFGEVGAQTDQYLEGLREYCQAFFYGLPVKFLPAVTVTKTRCSFRVTAIHTTFRSSLISWGVAKKLLKPKDAFCIIGITMIDLYPNDSWNFVFGKASLSEGEILPLSLY
uniref:Archaemetzincin-2 n=1 Tax=Sander lucioperca TaxID=283035 RepID=A0A8D0A4Q2_SANLU